MNPDASRPPIKLSFQFLIILLSNLFAQAISIGVSMVLVRNISKDIYGIFSQINFLTQFTVMILVAGIPGSIMYFYPRLDDNAKKALFIQTLAILSVIGIIGSIVLHMLSPLLAMKFNNPSLPRIMSFYAYSVALSMVASFFPAFLIVLGKVKTAASNIFILQAGQSAAILTALFTSNTLIAIFSFQCLFLCMYVAFTIVTTLYFLRQYTYKFDLNMLRAQIKYFLPITASNSIHYIGKQIDRYFVSLNFSVGSFAVFELGAREFPLVPQISETISTVSRTKLSKLAFTNEISTMTLIWSELIKKSWLLYCPLMFLLFSVAEEMYSLLYTESFVEAANLFRIFLLVMVFRTFNVGMMIESIGLTQIIAISSIIFAATNIASIYVSINIIGKKMIGPPIATFFASMVMFIFQSLSLWKYSGINIVKAAPIIFCIKVVMVCSVALLFGRLLMGSQFSNLSRIIFFCIGFLPIVFFGYWASGILDDDIKKIIRRFLSL